MTISTMLSIEEWAARLQKLTSAVQNDDDAASALHELAGIIKAELCNAETVPNQTVLNIAVRTYCQLQRKYNLQDEHFMGLADQPATYRNERDLQVLFAFVQVSSSSEIRSQVIVENCLKTFASAVTTENDDGIVLLLLKLVNLVCKKCADLSVDVDLTLEQMYHCLQSGQMGMREAILNLYSYSCNQSPERAFQHFQFIIEFWPWTNRNKLLMLSTILTSLNLCDALERAEHNAVEFFAGLRLSLSYKRLLAASQYLVKTLSNQNSTELLKLSAVILTSGSNREVQNFYSQWFSRIEQKDQLFQLIQCQPEIVQFLENSNTCVESTENFRLILVFNMFSRQIFTVSRLHFFKISTELITNCFQLQIDAQMLVFKFIVDNLCNFSIEDCLEFVLSFLQHHRHIDNPQHRNGILGRIPNIINYIAKMFSKHCAGDCTTLEASVITFFRQLQEMIDGDVSNGLFQPQIFAIRLFQILHKSLYSQTVSKNAKNCNVTQNQCLGRFLIERRVFDNEQMFEKLFKQLSCPQGYDDVHDLIVALLPEMEQSDSAPSCLLECKEMCVCRDVDECALSALHARVALQTNAADAAPKLFEYALKGLTASVDAFEVDPLLTCKNQNHLFGYINVINEVTLMAPQETRKQFSEIIALLERVVNIVLLKLNLINVRKKINATAADFHDMDESLFLLVQESAFKATESQEKCRKFLLMSFWLTLKACCDLGTSIGCHLVSSTDHSDDNLRALSQCLQLNVAVLTRCRHKGAIEAAGLSIGILTKAITSQSMPDSKTYGLALNCLDLLFDRNQRISTSRRGAGFSIMFLHVVKNEAQKQARPLLKHALNNVFKNLAEQQQQEEQESTNSDVKANANCDRIEALALHYLCVLVKDTELREALAPSYSEIMMAAIAQIDHTDWTVCNAALQLMGALIPKIVGQSQANEFETATPWELCELTYSELLCKLPKACNYILDYCYKNCLRSTATRSIILFLGLLAKVEHLRKRTSSGDDNDALLADDQQLQRFRELMWRLLRHECEKVRQLAAMCFVRAHDFRSDLPEMLLAVCNIVFSVRNENFFQGLLFTLHNGITKLQHESVYTLEPLKMAAFMAEIRQLLSASFKLQKSFKFYTLCKLFDVLLLVGFKREADIFAELTSVESTDPNGIGQDLWLERVSKVVAQ